MIKKWWPTVVHWLTVLVLFLTPSVMTWISAHPAKSTGIAAAWAFLLHLLNAPPTPVKKLNE